MYNNIQEVVEIPNIWTHILFAEELCHKMKRKDIIDTSSKDMNIGAQGPDPFFYHNFWPFLTDKHVSDVGMKLHTEKCGPFLVDMIKRGTLYKNRTQAFILGFVSHHVLDRYTHPYVHYRAGFEGNKHQLLEVLIDTMMLDRLHGLKTWTTPVHKKINIGKLTKSTERLLNSLIHQHFPELSGQYPSTYIDQSYKHIQMAQRVLYDPWKWKNKAFGSLVSSFSHQPIVEEKDYLNETRSAWKHPATNEHHSESFIDLYEQALEEGQHLFRLIFSYWQSPNPDTFGAIEQCIGNVSYDTGKPLEQKLTNLYSNPIV